MTTALVLDAIEQAIWTRNRKGHGNLDGLIHHSDAGSQYTSVTFTERLTEVGIDVSIGTVGDSFDNALAETINGLYKTELIKPRAPWRTVDQSSWPPQNGWTGSITDASTSTAATSHRPRWKQLTTLNQSPATR